MAAAAAAAAAACCLSSLSRRARTFRQESRTCCTNLQEERGGQTGTRKVGMGQVIKRDKYKGRSEAARAGNKIRRNN